MCGDRNGGNIPRAALLIISSSITASIFVIMADISRNSMNEGEVRFSVSFEACLTT